MARSNWLDNLIGFFSPSTKLNRIRAKAYSDIIGNQARKYEGASRGRRTAGWKTASTSANTEIKFALETLRNRSRDLVRNNPYAARGITAISTETIGRGIRAAINVKPDRSESAFTDLWKAWAETTACDVEGRHDLFGLQAMVMRAMAETGEVLIRKIRTRPTARRPFPMRLQVLEGDFIDSFRGDFKSDNGNTVIQGIEFDKKGNRVAYYLFQDHPGNYNMVDKSSFTSVRVPADEVLHVFRVERPGQVRGVPWLSPTMIRLRDFDEFEDATLVRQKVASMFVAFVKDVTAHDVDLSEDCKEELGEKMEPGQIELLPMGKDVVLADPPGTTDYKEYTSVVLHSIASGLGVPFECLTGDLSEVNFSSARMGWLQFQRSIDSWRSQILIPMFLDPMFDWFTETADLMGVTPKTIDLVWTPPRREMIDPTKEIPAIVNGVRAGIMTLSESVRQQGKDPEKHFAEIKRDNEMLDKLELTLDSDARKTNGSGAVQRV